MSVDAINGANAQQQPQTHSALPGAVAGGVGLGAVGALGGYFEIVGTPYSAGFGLGGFVGPLKYLDLVGWNSSSITLAVTLFIALPIILNLIFIKLFELKFKWIKSSDYSVHYE